MFDIVSLAYGALLFFVTLVALKIVDLVLEHFLNTTLFANLWNYLAKSVKKFLTRLSPIRICFQFRTQIEESEPSEIKKKIVQLLDSVSEKHKGRIEFSPLTWDDTNEIATVKMVYNQREYRMDAHISVEYRDYNPETEMRELSRQTISSISDSIAFSIETDFPFNTLDKMLLGLGALTSFLKDELNEVFPNVRFSKGMFTIAPIKGDFTMDHWIKQKQFEVSLLLKAQDKILVNLYPKRAEIIFPMLQIDDKISEYLRATLLNYYL
jgi:hypothetical protein